ncbi:AF4/FMR2 family member 2 isoform X1 [Synchiropus splendidus]|uniref:AF4/FMR2 family member 2 isoform X1 n=1 Tax=Synchiropus splendidus TaxID=270530 RepID=UPI00237E1E1E|nr:AF4/FMR2 family member 2 isoform X1 [Synchiropus splendidus]
MDLFELDFFRDWELEQPCHLESERSILKKREWERRNQEVQQDEDLFSTGFNLFGEPYKTNKGDALASRVQNTLGSYEEMKDLLTSQSNQSHLVGIPKGSSGNVSIQTPTASAPERSVMESQGFTEASRGDAEVGADKQSGNSTSTSMHPPVSSASSLLHQNSKKSRGSSDWLRGGHVPAVQGSDPVVGSALGQGHAVGGRGKMCLFEEQQRQEELFSSLKDELGLKGDSSPSSSSSYSSSSSTSSSRRRSTQPSKILPLSDGGNFRSSSVDVVHYKSSTSAESGHLKSSPFDNEASSQVSTSPLASTSVLSTPTPGLTTPTSGLASFPPGSLPGKQISLQQKPTAYVRPMDGQDQAPSDSPKLKPPLVVAEGLSNGQAFGTSTGKNKLPKLSLNHTNEVSLTNDSSCVEEILREMTHSWPPPLTAIHTPGKADQTKFPIPNKEPQHVTSGYSQKRGSVAVNKLSTKPPNAPQKSMLEDDLKISSDEEEAEQQVSDKAIKSRATTLSGGSGSSSDTESSSESDTDESESSSSDSEYNRTSRTHTPEPEPTNKWQLDSWLNKVQTQSKPLVPPVRDYHGSGTVCPAGETAAAPGGGANNKTNGTSNTEPTVAAEHKDAIGAAGSDFTSMLDMIDSNTHSSREKAKLSQRTSGEGQRSKTRLSPGCTSGSEVTPPKRISTGKKQPRRTERLSGGQDNPTWSRASQQSPALREKDLFPTSSLEHQNVPRAQIKPPGLKTAPRKEPRSATSSNNKLPATLHQIPAQTHPVSLNQDKRKHRGPCNKITPKSREFVETDSSSSSSECLSDSDEAIKIPAGPPQTTSPPINTVNLSNVQPHTPPLTTLSTAGSVGILGTFGGPSRSVKVSSNGTTDSSGSGGLSSSCNTLGIGIIGCSFGTSVPDPGGLGGACKDLECMSPADSPWREYQERQNLWVKIDLALLSRVPRQGRSKGPDMERDRKEETHDNSRERQKHDSADWSLLRDHKTFNKLKGQEEEREHLDHERQGARAPIMENQERLRMGGAEKTAGRREKDCPDMGTADISMLQQGQNPRLKAPRGDSGGKHKRPAVGNTDVPSDKHRNKRKHKLDQTESVVSSNKKGRLDKESHAPPACISPGQNHKNSSSESSLNRKQCRRRDDKLLPPLLSPLSDEPPHRQPGDGGASVGQESSAIIVQACSNSSSQHRHRKAESISARNNSENNHLGEKNSGHGYHANSQSESEMWSDAMMAPTEPRRPKLLFSDTVHTADHYMQEAKRLKHKADALMDKFGKAVNYTDGALSFIECGNAMERDPLEAKSPYTMYSETVELIRYAMRLKNFTSHSATVAEKKLAVLCNRCLSLLYLRMFHLKKDHAVKYSRSLMDYFKNSAKSSHQEPSPWRTNGKVTRTPSPLSLSPSASSTGVSSVSGGSGGVQGSSGSVAIPQRIHHMAASHVNITNNILRSYDHWETANRLSSNCQDFFQELDSVMEPLSQQGTMTQLVRYVRQGLHWLRSEAHLH